MQMRSNHRSACAKYSCALALTLAIAAGSLLAAQEAADLWRHYEAGRYQQVLDAAGADPSPAAQYLAALSAQKLGDAEQARQRCRPIAERPADDPWHSVCASALAVFDENDDAALAAARRATELGAGLPEAHYQLGLVLARRQDWKGAAEAFDTVTKLQPSNAYGYYYAGLSHYRLSRPDLMAVRFERFLKLAPDAPERPEVTQIMRTIRGR
jgi:predicted Zn-dependent protease